MFKMWIFVGILMASMAGAAYYYHTTTQTKIETLIEQTAALEANNVTLTNANEQNIATNDELQQLYAEVRQNYETIQTEFQIIRSQNDELRVRLGRHDLGALAAAKPELVERIINNASNEALRCFELLSGAQMNESERNATTANQFNSECPWIFDALTAP